MVFMNTHSNEYTHSTNSSKAICDVPSLGRVMYDPEMHFSAFLVTISQIIFRILAT